MSRLPHCDATLVAAVMLLGAAPAAAQSAPPIEYGAFVDLGVLDATTDPANGVFRNRGTTPRLDELDVNMAAIFVRRPAAETSRWGIELTAQTGEDSNAFGFSATAPNLRGGEWLRHIGPTNFTYLAPVGKGLTIQGGIFSSLIGYDSLYATDNLAYTRPWGADYTPHLMLGTVASYPASDALTFAAFVVNGYFHLAHANDAPSVGGQLAFKASNRFTLKQTLLYGSHQADTSLSHWRVLSDTIAERKTPRSVVALEYQLGSELVAQPARADDERALWMSAQAVVHASIAGAFSATLRPEFCWDRNGRWIGAPQSIVALTAGGDYQLPGRGVLTIVRGEYRLDSAGGADGGFFAGSDNHLVPSQRLWVLSAILVWTRSIS